MDLQVINPNSTLKSTLTVERLDGYYGWNVVNEFGDVVAYYDGNWDEYKFYEDFTNEQKADIKELIQYEI